MSNRLILNDAFTVLKFHIIDDVENLVGQLALAALLWILESKEDSTFK